MYYYRELTLLPDAYVTVHFLWTKLFSEVHYALVEGKTIRPNMNIGCTWPDYTEESLGRTLRLITNNREDLELLPLEKRLTRYRDYCHITSVRPVGERRIQGYAVYRRYQPDGAINSKARRFVKRHPEISLDEARHLLKQKKRKYLPFIQLKSDSTGQQFSLFIEKETPAPEVKAPFSAYGLSTRASLPEF